VLVPLPYCRTSGTRSDRRRRWLLPGSSALLRARAKSASHPCRLLFAAAQWRFARSSGGNSQSLHDLAGPGRLARRASAFLASRTGPCSGFLALLVVATGLGVSAVQALLSDGARRPFDRPSITVLRRRHDFLSPGPPAPTLVFPVPRSARHFPEADASSYRGDFIPHRLSGYPAWRCWCWPPQDRGLEGHRGRGPRWRRGPSASEAIGPAQPLTAGRLPPGPPPPPPVYGQFPGCPAQSTAWTVRWRCSAPTGVKPAPHGTASNGVSAPVPRRGGGTAPVVLIRPAASVRALPACPASWPVARPVPLPS